MAEAAHCKQDWSGVQRQRDVIGPELSGAGASLSGLSAYVGSLIAVVALIWSLF